MRKSSWAILAAASVAAGIYESAFLGSAPFPFYYLHPVLPCCVLFFLLNRRLAAYATAGLSGAVIDLMSAGSPGLVTVRWLCVMLMIDLLAEGVATNRSLYASMLLVGAARLADRVLWLMVTWSLHFLFRLDLAMESWTRFLGILGVDLALTALFFVAISLFTKRFVISVSQRHTRYE